METIAQKPASLTSTLHTRILPTRNGNGFRSDWDGYQRLTRILPTRNGNHLRPHQHLSPYPHTDPTYKEWKLFSVFMLLIGALLYTDPTYKEWKLKVFGAIFYAGWSTRILPTRNGN